MIFEIVEALSLALVFAITFFRQPSAMDNTRREGIRAV